MNTTGSVAQCSSVSVQNMSSFFTGDDTGLVKKVHLSPRFDAGSVVSRWGNQAAGAGAERLCHLESIGLVGAGLGSGSVRFWRSDGAADVQAVAEFSVDDDTALGTAGLHAVDGASPRVIAVDNRGCVRVWRWAQANVEAIPAMSFEMGKRVHSAVVTACGSRVAAGGRDSDVAVWDVDTMKEAFKARNVPHDNLDLPVPVWISGVSFVSEKPQQLVASTGFVDQRLRGEVRLYDASAQRRPVMRKIAPLGEEALTAITCACDGMTVLAGSCSGSMARLDLRMSLNVLCRFKGAAGSVRALSVHPSLPIFASASLDRQAPMNLKLCPSAILASRRLCTSFSVLLTAP